MPPAPVPCDEADELDRTPRCDLVGDVGRCCSSAADAAEIAAVDLRGERRRLVGGDCGRGVGVDFPVGVAGSCDPALDLADVRWDFRGE